jgi:radical SAM protein with 4Fe4S-binding SPASM domain
MEKCQAGLFFVRLHKKVNHFPLNGQIELTYRCNLNCIHCYCKGSEDKARELNTEEWKRILDEIQKEGCLNLTITGGEPLIREDFLEIYSYAKAKGFIITLFTNGLAMTTRIADYLAELPPVCIEVTLNGITADVYEAITRVRGSFSSVMRNLKILKEKELPLKLKANCLKQNKDQIGRIKAFTEELLGKLPRRRYHFGYDPMIYPRLDKDKRPVNYRLPADELIEVRRQDVDIWEEYQKGLHSKVPDSRRERDFLYNCDAWMTGFFINPYGRLRFCLLSDKFSADLKAGSFAQGFYGTFPQLLKAKFKTNSKCKDCRLRQICYHCPARAYLETGDEEAPVPYYCALAEAWYRERKKSHK